MTTATAEIEKPQSDVATQPKETEMSLLKMERQDIHKEIDTLSEESILRLSHYIEFLRYEGASTTTEKSSMTGYSKTTAGRSRTTEKMGTETRTKAGMKVKVKTETRTETRAKKKVKTKTGNSWKK